MVIFIYFLTKTNNEGNLITIGIFAAALFRLMPILNRISTYSQRLKFGVASIDKIEAFIKDEKNLLKNLNDHEFTNEINLKNISYKFENQNSAILEDINLKIKSKEIMGIYGESGSGKTTLSNIIMGLIIPTTGEIEVDGKKLLKKIFQFKRT